MRVFIAGATGVLGRRLVENCVDRGHDVVGLTTFLGPIVGVALTWREHRLGVLIFTLSMAGGLLLGGVLHFAVENPNNVAAIPPDAWRLPFQVSAVGVAVVPAIALVVGATYWQLD